MHSSYLQAKQSIWIKIIMLMANECDYFSCVSREDILLIRDRRSLVPRSANILFWFKDGDRHAPEHHIWLCSLYVQMITAGHCLTWILMGTGYLIPAKLLLRSSGVNVYIYRSRSLNKTGDSLLPCNLTSQVHAPTWEHNKFWKKTEEGRKILLKAWKLYSVCPV